MENIDQLFRDKLSDYSPTPPAGGWQRIQGALAAQKKTPIIPVWLRIAASILFITGTITLGWRLFTRADVQSDQQLAGATTTSENIPSVQSAEVINPEIPANITPSSDIVKSRPASVIAPEAENEKPVLAAKINQNEMTPAEEPVSASETSQNIDYSDSKDVILANPLTTEEPSLKEDTGSSISPTDLIIQQNLLALEEKKSAGRKNSWSVGGIAGPQYSYRDVTVNTVSYPVDDYDNYESGVMAYAGGFQVEVEPAKRFSVQSGIYYSKIGQVKTTLQIDNQFAGINDPWIYNGEANLNTRGEAGLPTEVVNSTGNISFEKNLPPSVDQANQNIEWIEGAYSIEQYFEFLEIPLVVRYKLIDRKFNLNVSSGLWANILVGNKAIATDNQSVVTEGETTEINTLNYCGSLSLGVGYPISQNLSLSLEPYFKYYLSPINTNPETQVYPYSMGIMSGIRYMF